MDLYLFHPTPLETTGANDSSGEEEEEQRSSSSSDEEEGAEETSTSNIGLEEEDEFESNNNNQKQARSPKLIFTTKDGQSFTMWKNILGVDTGNDRISLSLHRYINHTNNIFLLFYLSKYIIRF